jgi:hypothetical protein
MRKLRRYADPLCLFDSIAVKQLCAPTPDCTGNGRSEQPLSSDLPNHADHNLKVQSFFGLSQPGAQTTSTRHMSGGYEPGQLLSAPETECRCVNCCPHTLSPAAAAYCCHPLNSSIQLHTKIQTQCHRSSPRCPPRPGCVLT